MKRGGVKGSKECKQFVYGLLILSCFIARRWMILKGGPISSVTENQIYDVVCMEPKCFFIS